MTSPGNALPLIAQPVKLGEILREGCFQNGLYKHMDSYGKGAPILRINDFDNAGRLLSREFSRVALSEDEYRQFAIRERDILVNRVNSLSHVGKSMLVPPMAEYPVFESNMMRIRIGSDSPLMPEYVAAVLQGNNARRHFLKVAKPAVAQASINQDDVRAVAIVIYPKPVQARIAAALAVWTDAIATNEALVSATEQRRAGLMEALLTGARRLKGFTATWCHWHLGELFRERVEPNRKDLPLLSITAEEGVVPRADLDRKDTSSEDKSKYLRICPGDIGYNTMRMWQGVSALSRHEGIVSPAYTVCIPGPDIDGKFASYLFKLPAVIHLFYRYSQGLTSDTWNLKFHHFAEIRVRIPEVDEQMAIASVLAAMDEELAILRKQRDALAQQKRGLMQKLLTGQWRVPNTNIEKETCSC